MDMGFPLAMVTAQRMARKRAHGWSREENFLSVTFGKLHQFRGENSDLLFQMWSCYIEVEKSLLEGGRQTVKMRPTHQDPKAEEYELTSEEIVEVLISADIPVELRPEWSGQ